MVLEEKWSMLRPSHWRKKTKFGVVVSWIWIHPKVSKTLLFTRLESFSVCVEVKNTGVSKSAKYSVATINTSTTKTCRRIEMEVLGSCICQQKLFLDQFLLLLRLEKGAQYWFSTDTSAGCHKKPETKTFFMWDLLKKLFQATIRRGIAQYHWESTLCSRKWKSYVQMLAWLGTRQTTVWGHPVQQQCIMLEYQKSLYKKELDIAHWMLYVPIRKIKRSAAKRSCILNPVCPTRAKVPSKSKENTRH